MVELTDEEKKRVFQLKTVESKTYKEIQEIFRGEGREISQNQVREVVRLGVHGSTELADQMNMDTQKQRRKYLNELDKILKTAKSKEELVTAIGAINTGLKALDGMDKYLGKGVSPKTQNIYILLEGEKEFRNRIYDVLIAELPKEILDRVQGKIEEAGRVIEAKYKVVE